MWYNITNKYNNVEYKKGGWDINEGLDRFSLIILFMKDLNHNVDKFINTKLKGSIESFIINNYTKVDKFKKGDICFIKHSIYTDIGIYIGQGLMLCIFENYGVMKIKLKLFTITEVYRCQ